MARAAAFKQSDITRAVKGVLDAGARVARMRIRNGEIEIVFGEGEAPPVDESPLQKWQRENGHGQS